MESYKPKEITYNYNLSKEMIKLLCDTKEAYGEYKGYLKSSIFDHSYFLEQLLINDIYYSLKIDNSKIEKNDMFYMEYKIKNNDVIIFNNLKKILIHAIASFTKEEINIDIINKLHKSLYKGCKKESLIKGCGHIRNKQTYILKPGIAGSTVSFIPTEPKILNQSVKNIINYLNNKQEESFILLALFHLEFEKIHPYNTGNGLLGRILLPSLCSIYKKEAPILLISQSLYELRNTYFTQLSSYDNNEEQFIKFFLHSIINQCNKNIKKLKKINKIYKRDYDSLKENIGGSTIYKVFPHILKRVVFTTNDIINDTSLHINSINKVLTKLVEANYLTKEKKKGTNRVTFKYTNIFNLYMEEN